MEHESQLLQTDLWAAKCIYIYIYVCTQYIRGGRERGREGDLEGEVYCEQSTRHETVGFPVNWSFTHKINPMHGLRW
jgi:hypothetical protein